ncbi:helix-turn-helix domain-containing protein [Sunxiuqinia indica]|uniref:helix-turn-helix domain-containing protein n=1 Tax=Sunxiuqinia indica TaxID=2692584 RepID=UPI00135CF5D9|nr:helix-turn-helix domain-containing protein [Sunxiuqinia indica]
MTKSKSHIDIYLEKIIESHVFSKSPVNRELLKYLVQSSFKGEKPKEFQIAADVFGKKYNPEKEVNVRVYVHNLRKKLKEYYEQEGQEDDLIFELPKGQYTIDFKHLPIKAMKKNVNRFTPVLFLFSVFILAGVLLFHVFLPSKPVKIEFWKPFFSTDFTTRIVLGDHYFYRGTVPSGQYGSMRDSRINSDAEFDNFVKQHPELIDQVEKNDITYVNNQAPMGLFNLLQLVGGKHQNIEMDFSSRVKLEDFRDENLIFIGSFKTLQDLKKTVEKLGLIYNIEESVLNYQVGDSTFAFNNRATSYLSYEYATVSYFELPDGRCVLFFLCDRDIGNMALTKYFTDETKMKAFETKIQTLDSKNFKAVFEVKGENRTDFDIHLIRLDALPANVSEIWP